MEAVSPDGQVKRFAVRLRVDSRVEMDYLRHGGLLPFVLRSLLVSR